jgi:hypothetical protein
VVHTGSSTRLNAWSKAVDICGEYARESGKAKAEIMKAEIGKQKTA